MVRDRLVYDEQFEDENLDIPHDQAGLLSMANRGSDTNSSQFFITCDKTPWLDKKHVVFGRVADLESMNVVKKIQNARIQCIDTNGFQAFSKKLAHQETNILQYVDLTPTLIRVLKKKTKYAHSFFAPSRFGKSVFFQMMSDFGMRTLKSSKEYYSGSLAHLQIFQPSTDISVLRGYDQPLFIPYIQLVPSKSYQDQQKKAFRKAAKQFLQFREQDSQQVAKVRDYYTLKMIELCRKVVDRRQTRDQFVDYMTNFSQRTIIIVDEYDKALLPQDGDNRKTQKKKKAIKNSLANAIMKYKGQTNIIVSGFLKLRPPGINSGINHFHQYVTDGFLGPQPLGFTKSRIQSDKIKFMEMIQAAFQYRSSKSKPLYINTSYLLPNVEQRYKQEDIQEIEYNNFLVNERLKLTSENFIDVIFQLYDGYRMTLDPQHLKEQTSIPPTIFWKSIGVVLNIDQQEFPIDQRIEFSSSKYVKKFSKKMNLFQILKNNQRVEVEQSFFKTRICSSTDQDENEVIRRKLISMLYYGGCLTIKDLIDREMVVLGPPNWTVYQNLLKMFNNADSFKILNQKLNSFCKDSIPVPENVWQNSLIALNQMQAGLCLFTIPLKQKLQLNLTSNIARFLSPHLPDFLIFRYRQTYSGKRPDTIIIFEKSTKKPIVILQYLISDFFSKAQLENLANRDYQDEFESVKEKITVLVDKRDMKTILMAKVRRKDGYEKFIIDRKSN